MDDTKRSENYAYISYISNINMSMNGVSGGTAHQVENSSEHHVRNENHPKNIESAQQ
jgi:hypothetical protein